MPEDEHHQAERGGVIACFLGGRRVVKAREHLPTSHYHAVSSCESEEIWPEKGEPGARSAACSMPRQG